MFKKIVALFICCGISVSAFGASNPNDPFEPVNRVVYHFNDTIDKGILKPVAIIYNKIMPKPFAKCVTNFFANLDTIPTVANDLLMFNFYQATSDAWRLGINSTFGMVGLFDFATDMGLEPNTEDFGLTLAHWGWTNSNFIMLPFFGPSTFRDGVALPINYYFLTVYPYINPPVYRYRLYAFGVVAKRADLLNYENVMQEAALDDYAFLRDAYLQRRNYLIERNKELGDPYLNSSSE
jgi:phospholipid-binding lipoprotein MlaA